MAASTRSTSTSTSAKRLTFEERIRETGDIARDILKGVTESDLSIRAVALSVIMDFEDKSLELATTSRANRPSMPDRVKLAVESTETFYREKAGYMPRHLRLGSRLGVDAIYGGGRISYEESTVEAEVAKVNQRIADNLERSRIDRENREKAAKVASATSKPSRKPKTRKRSNGKSKDSTPVTMPTPKQSTASKKRRYTKPTSKVVTKS